MKQKNKFPGDPVGEAETLNIGVSGLNPKQIKLLFLVLGKNEIFFTKTMHDA